MCEWGLRFAFESLLRREYLRPLDARSPYPAILGFVFYLWLGAWGAWHFPALEKLLARVPAIAMLGLIFLTLTLALAETKLLHALGSIDP